MEAHRSINSLSRRLCSYIGTRRCSFSFSCVIAVVVIVGLLQGAGVGVCAQQITAGFYHAFGVQVGGVAVGWGNNLDNHVNMPHVFPAGMPETWLSVSYPHPTATPPTCTPNAWKEPTVIC